MARVRIQRRRRAGAGGGMRARERGRHGHGHRHGAAGGKTVRVVHPFARFPVLAKKNKKGGLAPPGSTLAQNRKATFEYHILERIEAGMVLLGSEVKSIRDAKVSLVEAFAQFRGHELYLLGAHVAEYTMAHARNHDPVRPRKLLLHRRELDRLETAVRREGYTIVPLSIYLKDGRIKLELGLAKGKQVHDKRASIKDRDQKREMDRALRER
jgi:SsrA-binding protein